MKGKRLSSQSIAIVGPTACGKTRRAVEIAKEFDGEIISADSRQLYRDMTIGTGKDLEEYGEIRYHLIDVAEAGDKYNLYRYLQDFNNVYKDILEREKLPVICGGSGMYVENALRGIVMPEVPENVDLRKRLSSKSLNELTEILKGYKTLHNKTDVDTVKRAVRAIEICEYYRCHPEEAITTNRNFTNSLDCLVIGLDIPRDLRREKISKRLKARLEQGMVDEIRMLLNRGVSAEDLIYYGLEYKYVTLYVTEKMSYDEMVRQLETAIHQFAKRQMTWFRGMEKRGVPIKWLPYDISKDDLMSEILKIDINKEA